MKTRTNPLRTGAALGLLILTGCTLTARAAATQSSFSLRSVGVAWLNQDPPQMTPSGNLKIRGWRHLWYDNATDDRMTGYNTVEANANINKDGHVVVGGTFTVREKLDDLTAEDFASGNFQLDDVVQGRILWQGTWHQGQGGVGTAVAHNDAGMTVFYYFTGTADPDVLLGGGCIVDPHGD